MTTTRARLVRLTAVVALLAVAACSGTDTDPNPTSGEPDAPTTAPTTESTGERTDWPVGRTTLTPIGERGATLTVDVWYPAADGPAEPSVYEFLPGLSYPSDTALDAPQVADGSFPLVIYSHGSGGLRYISSFLTEELAARGYIVASVDHTGDTALDLLGGSVNDFTLLANNRAADLRELLTALETENSNNTGVFGGRIDFEHVGVVGHSMGAVTAVEGVVGHDSVHGTHTPVANIDAVVAYAPATLATDLGRLENLDVPTLVISGTADITTPVESYTEPLWDAVVAGAGGWRIDIDHGGHQSFTDVCWYQELLRELPDVPEIISQTVGVVASQGCGEGIVDIDVAQRITVDATVAFLDEHLHPDRSAAPEIAGVDVEVAE